jgi:hypothetical protein
MAIQSLEFSKNSDEKYKSDVKITLKQITFAKYRKLESSGRSEGQKSNVVNLGEVGENDGVAYKIFFKK